MAIYALTFNDSFATRDKITTYLDTRRDIVSDWYYCLTNTIFVVTTKPPPELAQFLLNLSKEGRFYISEIKKYPLNEGWLPQDAWNFINKYAT